MMRQFIGLCAALAFVAASPSAYALKIADEVPANRVLLMADMDSFTYAAETLLTDEVTEVDGDSTKYYNVDGTGGNGNLVLSAPADVGATVGDIYVVAVTLNGMVFRSVPALSGGESTDYDVATGGTVGDKMVVYRLSEGSIDAASAILSLTGQFAVSSRGGSASLTMTNQTLANLNIDGVDGSATHSGSVIKVAPALKETATPVDLTAEVVSSFKKFSGGMTVGHVGSIEVGIVGHRTATGTDGGTAVTDLEDILITALDDGDPQSTISFMGDFSFTEKVYVHGDDDCGVPVAGATDSAAPDETLGTDAADIRMTEGEGDDEVVTDTTEAVNVDTATDQTTVSATHYLCLVVQGDDVEGDDPMAAPRIPDTDAYMVMGKYTGLEDAAIGPKPMERTLGEINRDGTTVHIPYMTTYEGYNQRIVLSNRSSTDAPYEITFRPEVGVTAEGSSMAEGTLMGNTTVTFRTNDLVTLTGGARTAATIILEAQPKDIDVTSVIVNTESRDTDTVVHHSM
jgi:hypothetical protein